MGDAMQMMMMNQMMSQQMNAQQMQAAQFGAMINGVNGGGRGGGSEVRAEASCGGSGPGGVNVQSEYLRYNVAYPQIARTKLSEEEEMGIPSDSAGGESRNGSRKRKFVEG